MKGWILSLALLMFAFPALAQSDVINKSELAPQVAAASGEKMEWLPSFTGVSADGLFKIHFVKVPTDQAPRIVFNTRGIYDTRFKAEVNEEKMLVITERIGSRTKSDTEVTIYYNTLETIRIAGADATFESPIDCPMTECRFSDGATVRAEFDVKDLQMEITGKSVVVLTGVGALLGPQHFDRPAGCFAGRVHGARHDGLEQGRSDDPGSGAAEDFGRYAGNGPLQGTSLNCCICRTP